MPNKRDWGDILVIAIIATGLSSLIGLLLRFGFDRDATFAFLGAIVGAALAVGLTVAHEGRSERRKARAELKAVTDFFSAQRIQFRGDLEFLGDPDHSDGAKMGRCVMLRAAATNLYLFVTEAVETAAHFDFTVRAFLRQLSFDAERLIAVAVQTNEAADELHGKFDGDAIQRALRNVLNGFSLVEAAAGLPSSQP